MRSKPIPIACTLDDGGAADQLGEWAALQERATSRHALPHGARMTFRSSLLSTVEDLARREQACCAFLDIDVQASGATVVVEITTDDADAMPVIAALAGLPPAPSPAT